MHRLIRILVLARDAEGALDASQEVVHEKLRTSSLGDPFRVEFINDEYFGKDQEGTIQPILEVSTAHFSTDDMRDLKMMNSAMENKNRRSRKAWLR